MTNNTASETTYDRFSTAVSRDYTFLMTHNKDETGRGLSRILLLMVV